MLASKCAAVLASVLNIVVPHSVVQQVELFSRAPLYMAVMAVESGFDANAQSHAGAKGIMQLTPIAVQEVRDRNPHCVPANFDPLNQHHNIYVGMCYLKLLEDDYKQLPLVLAAYNGGGRQARQLAKLQGMDSETANYVTKVLYVHSLCLTEPSNEKIKYFNPDLILDGDNSVTEPVYKDTQAR